MVERPHTVSLNFIPKTYDIDFAGIVSNIVHIRWLEDLRLAFLERYFPLKEQLEGGISPVLAHTAIHYRRPIRLFEPVIGEMWLKTIDDRRWTLAAEFTRAGEVVASAEQIGAYVSLKTLRSIPIPDRFLKLGS